MTPSQISKLVTRAATLRAEIENRKADLDALTSQICDLGRGKYLGDGCEVTVIETPEGKPSFKLAASDEEKAREIAGEGFSKVFEKKVSFEPCKSFSDVVIKLFPKAISNKLLALTEKPGKAANAYLKWS